MQPTPSSDSPADAPPESLWDGLRDAIRGTSADYTRIPLRRAVFLLAVALSVLLLAMSAWFSWAALVNLWNNGMKSYALQIPAWYYQAAVPFGFALIIIRYLQYAMQVLRDPDHAPHEVPDV